MAQPNQLWSRVLIGFCGNYRGNCNVVASVKEGKGVFLNHI